MLGDAPQILSSSETSQEEKERLILESYEEMLKEWEQLRKPDGRQPETPAVTCAQMFVHHPEAESGYYFIDPNEGSPTDSFQVFCDRADRSSCVDAVNEQIPMANHKSVSRNGHSWYSELNDNGAMVSSIKFTKFGNFLGISHKNTLFSAFQKQFEYQITLVQLNFLQLLSNTAYQNITYLCQNSVAYFDESRNSHSKSVKLMTNDELELVALSGSAQLQYKALLDQCKSRKNSTEKTILEYRTGKCSRKNLEFLFLDSKESYLFLNRYTKTTAIT